MKFWLLLVAASLIHAQPISGRFYLEKKEYIAGEPIFVILEVTNPKSAPPVRISISHCWYYTRFEAPTAPNPDQVSLYGCARPGVVGSCSGAWTRLLPGERQKIRYLLQGPFRLDSPGIYPIRAWHLADIFFDNDQPEKIATQEIKADFEVSITPGDPAKLAKVYAPVVRDLRSSDYFVRETAVSAVTEYAPAFLEEIIMSLADDPQTAALSISGLRRLGTKRAKDKLAELAGTIGSEAIRTLGELGDPAYCPLMLDLARNSPDYSRFVAMRAAGALCEQRAVPLLTSLLTSVDKSSRFELVYALGNSHSRDAVPVLIPLLADLDENVRRAASDALKTLTHRDQQDFALWWPANSATAKIYSIRECDAPR